MADILLRILNIKKPILSKEKPIEALKGVTLIFIKGRFSGCWVPTVQVKPLSHQSWQPCIRQRLATLLMNGTSIYRDLIGFRQNIGFCPQKPNFASALTVREHLVFAGRFFLMDAKTINARVDELLHRFELQTYADKSPAILSGGYKQRLLIARSLVHKPLLLILDEPTVALDPHIRRQLWDLIQSTQS